MKRSVRDRGMPTPVDGDDSAELGRWAVAVEFMHALGEAPWRIKCVQPPAQRN
jgi:hypothetical protein